MKKAVILSVLLLSFLLCACNNTDNSDPNTGSTVADQQETEASAPASTVEITSEYLQVYQNALGDVCATYTAELKNTSETAVAITNTSIDIEKPDGTLLTSTDFFSVYPRVVPAGESAYICSDVINSLNEGVTSDQIGTALLHFDTEPRSDSDSLPVEITELTLGSQYGYPKFMGRIENVGTTDLSNIYIAAPIRDANETLQGVGFTIVDSLAVGEKKGFEQTCMSVSTDLDYSQSTVTAFAYDGSLF